MAARKGTGPRKSTGKPKPVSMGKGKPAAQRPWNDADGKGAEGLEWTVPSPAPFHTFETPPTVK